MGKVAKKTMALALSLCTILLMLPLQAQAYSFSETAGTLSISYRPTVVVPKGESVYLSVKAETSDGHAISYQWSELKDSGKTDKDGYTLWRVTKLKEATGASYTVQSITEDKTYQCEVWCDDSNYDAVYEDIYAADVLKLNASVSYNKTSDKYEEKYFTFTPSESGTYVFSSSGTAEARLYVFDEMEVNSNNIISDYESNDSGTGGKALVDLKGGHSYAIQAYLGSSEKGSYSVQVQKYAQTDFALTAKTTSYNVDKKSASTTMKVSASSGKVTYQWYQYDPLEWDYVPINGANQASYTVKNSSLQWLENHFRCDATNQYGESSTLYFQLYHDADWCAYSNGSDERVSYNASASLKVMAGEQQDIYDAYGEWISEEFVEDSKGKSYQWYVLSYDDSYYDGDKFVAITGATSSTYKTGAVKDNQRYLCVVKDSSGICDYRQYYVRPALMDITVDKTYYPVNDGGDVSVKINASAKESKTTFDYQWYKGEETKSDGYTQLEYSAIGKYEGKSSIRLTDVTETQYLRCEVWAYTEKSGVKLSDYVDIDFVVDPGTGYDQMYTTSADKNVKGASVMANSEITENSDGTYTTVTTSPDGSKSQSVTEKNKDGSSNVKVESKETNSAGKSVKVTVITTLNAKNKVTAITDEYVIDKAAKDTSAEITVRKDKDGEVTDTSALITTASKNKKSTIAAGVLAQILEAAGKNTKSVIVTMNVTDTKGKSKYTVMFDSSDITSGNELYLFEHDEKADTCTKTDKKPFTVTEKGNITVSASSDASYVLAKNESDAWKILGEVRIADEDTPLGAAEDTCYVHWIILILTLLAGTYHVVRIFARRRRAVHEEKSQEV